MMSPLYNGLSVCAFVLCLPSECRNPELTSWVYSLSVCVFERWTVLCVWSATAMGSIRCLKVLVVLFSAHVVWIFGADVL